MTSTSAPHSRILYVDDDEVHRYTVAKMLTRAGYSVEEAANGRTGLRLARKRPDLIILDVNLPDMKGFLVTKALRADPETSSIPVMHVSATSVLARDKTEGLEHGADAYLTEPLDEGELLATVKALIRIRESEEKAMLLAREWETTFNSIEDAVCSVDSSGRIQRCNSVMANLLERTAEACRGDSLPVLLRDRFGQSAVSNFGLEDNSILGRSEIALGSQVYRVRKSQVNGVDGRPTTTVLTLTDITAVKRAEKEREKHIDELARSNSELNHFAQIASHDLKEPLRMVSTYLELLARRYPGKPLDEQANEYIRFAVEGARRMSRFIDDLMDYSLVGRENEVRQPFDMEKLAATACKNLQEAIKDSGASVIVAKLPTLSVDPVRLTQLLQNLFGNAIKFVKGKSPEIFLSAEKQDRFWRFCVQDNGIGIKEQYLSMIFDMFRRLHGRREFPGTGIGLSTCRKIVEQHGGRIWAESEEGVGSRFYFTLPV